MTRAIFSADRRESLSLPGTRVHTLIRLHPIPTDGQAQCLDSMLVARVVRRSESVLRSLRSARRRRAPRSRPMVHRELEGQFFHSTGAIKKARKTRKGEKPRMPNSGHFLRSGRRSKSFLMSAFEFSSSERYFLGYKMKSSHLVLYYTQSYVFAIFSLVRFVPQNTYRGSTPQTY